MTVERNAYTPGIQDGASLPTLSGDKRYVSVAKHSQRCCAHSPAFTAAQLQRSSGLAVRGQPFCLLLGRRTMQRPPRGILLRAQRLDALARRGGCRGGRRGSARGRAWAPAKVRNSFPQPSVAGARERRSASSLRVRRLTCVCGGGGRKGGGALAVALRGSAPRGGTLHANKEGWCFVVVQVESEKRGRTGPQCGALRAAPCGRGRRCS